MKIDIVLPDASIMGQGENQFEDETCSSETHASMPRQQTEKDVLTSNSDMDT